jgi:uncharacterized protein YecE (DUF72 family)
LVEDATESGGENCPGRKERDHRQNVGFYCQARRAYPSATLGAWRKAILLWHSRGCDSYVYFDNDQKSAAPMDALALCRLLAA